MSNVEFSYLHFLH